MQRATTKRISFSDMIREDDAERTGTLFFDDAAWVISSPIVNVAQRISGKARREDSEAMVFGRPQPTEQIEGDMVPLTISREQAAFRRVQRAVVNQRGSSINRNTAFKPF